MNCDYGKCEAEAVVTGTVYAKSDDGNGLTPVRVNACEKHKKKDGFFPDQYPREEA